MKRVVLFFMAAVMAISLVGCGERDAAPTENEAPTVSEVFSAKTVITLRAAITTLDMFLASEIGAEEASDELCELADGLGTDDEYEEMAQFGISMAGHNLLFYAGTDNDRALIQEIRDALYDYLISGDFIKSFGLETYE